VLWRDFHCAASADLVTKRHAQLGSFVPGCAALES
jgi:hypothetical protein